MTSVERILEYKHLPPEGVGRKSLSSIEQRDRPWPTQGEIVVQNVKARYRKHLPYAIKGISFTIEPAQHVGICGRTGRLTPFHDIALIALFALFALIALIALIALFALFALFALICGQW